MGKAKKDNEIQEVSDKVNPFDTGVNYADFIEALDGDKVEDYLKDICTPEQIEWLIEDLNIYKKSLEKKKVVKIVEIEEEE